MIPPRMPPRSGSTRTRPSGRRGCRLPESTRSTRHRRRRILADRRRRRFRQRCVDDTVPSSATPGCAWRPDARRPRIPLTRRSHDCRLRWSGDRSGEEELAPRSGSDRTPQLEDRTLSTHRYATRLTGLVVVAGAFVLAACSTGRRSAASAGGAAAGDMARSRSTAAKAEGTLTTIALPHTWCNYGEMLTSFSDQVRHHDQRAQPGRQLGRRDRRDQGQQGQPGPAGAGRHRRRPVLRPAGPDRRPDPAVQGLDLGHHPGRGQGCRRQLVRRLLRRPGLRGQHRRREERPEGLGRPAQARVQGPGRAVR